ncbi:efflux RND transporter periplasmic adaptor subunit [Agarilytica rhodophyticola]|uniref:efflux RND transporter periplasmic adaptor subunit n=1 Tax=Agarilytica rhodophyticola TaxID=1737490 RepID=UPI000B3417EE|nr:efflux RND transporter periplasmic adaptor subunit [Agarilytica rhodophyticola]
MRVLLFLIMVLTSSVWSAEDIYLCPMHPHISGEQGDTCPVCGMTLVPKVNDLSNDADAMAASEGKEISFRIDPSYVHVLGVKVDKVGYHEFGRNIRAFGLISPSTRLEYTFAIKEEGWVEDLFASAIGDVVNKGEVLFSLYSPAIIEAQSDYLIGQGKANPEQILHLAGMDKKAIALFKKQRLIQEHIPFHSPINGVVTQLNVRRGSFLAKGSVAMTIQNFSKVWVNADVPLRDAKFLNAGGSASIILPESGERYSAIVDHIHPINNPQSRTATVRLVIDNPIRRLRPETYVDIIFDADVERRLAVAAEAVLYSQRGAYVIEDLGEGRYRPVEVETGITSSGMTEIKRGLLADQSVVRSGQFMLDAESNLRSGMTLMEHHDNAEASHKQHKEMSDHVH